MDSSLTAVASPCMGHWQKELRSRNRNNQNKWSGFRCFPVPCRAVFTFPTWLTLSIKGVEGPVTCTRLSASVVSFPFCSFLKSPQVWDSALTSVHMFSQHRSLQEFQSRAARMELCVSWECKKGGSRDVYCHLSLYDKAAWSQSSFQASQKPGHSCYTNPQASSSFYPHSLVNYAWFLLS